MKEHKEFQTETKKLLNLMINSIYSNKEIFLRELISNASDAIDKYKYLSYKDSTKYPSCDFQITINKDEKERWIEIKDNGIGMGKEEIINNLGTIAKSGSKDFVEKLSKAKDDKDLSIIGQFGVGFYSAFMVCKNIEVRTRSNDDNTGYLFTSDGLSSYDIEPIELNEHGTSIKLFLKDNTEDENYDDYLKDYTIENLVSKYSDYIRYPIKMDITSSTPKLDKDGKVIEGEYDTKVETKTLNSMIPIWKKPKKDVTEKDLNEFYKSKYNDYEDPFFSLNIKAEGLLEYNALIFVPSHAPYNLYSENYEKGLDLYVKGVFIKDHTKELVPDYLKFIKGLVDSDDFSLNISREMLQNSPLLNKICSNIEKKVVDKFAQIKKDDYEKYLKIFDVYGNHIKFGIYSSYGSKKDMLQDLLVFNSLNNEKPISLKDYKDKMIENQKAIYYVSGQNLDDIKNMPQLEAFKKKGIDVLLLKDSIDEFVFMFINEYDGVKLKSITEENSEELDQEQKDKLEQLNNEHKRLIDNLKDSLKSKVDDVCFSTSLVDSPVCVQSKQGVSLNMEKVLKDQPGADSNSPKASKVLEINPDSDLFKAISSIKDDDLVKNYASLLYDEAMLLQGFEIEDKKDFVSKLNSLMLLALKK